MTVKYTAKHEWIQIEEDLAATVGITEHAQDSLGKIVFVELPEVGKIYAQDDKAGLVESVKAASDIFMPVAGRVVEVNETLRNDPALANSDPMGKGWFFKVEVSDMGEFDQLMDEPAYQKLFGQKG